MQNNAIRGISISTPIDTHNERDEREKQEALDRINEWALDTFGDELLSEGEPLAIAPDMVGRIAELRQEAAE